MDNAAPFEVSLDSYLGSILCGCKRKEHGAKVNMSIYCNTEVDSHINRTVIMDKIQCLIKLGVVVGGVR